MLEFGIRLIFYFFFHIICLNFCVYNKCLFCHLLFIFYYMF